MATHPLSESLVVGQQRRVVAAVSEPRDLRLGPHVKQARRDPVEPNRRGRREHLARRDRIAGWQQVPALGLELQRPLDDGLGRPLAPDDIPNRGHGDDVVELDAFDFRRPAPRDRPTHG
jgi:hypothetical protein